MTTIRKFCCNDLLGFTSVNLDRLTITSEMSLYLTWLAKWSDYCHVAVTPGSRIIGYILGAAEEQAEGPPWQGLVQAVNVASGYRRQKFATRLMQTLEKQLVEKMRVSQWYPGYFVCLYVGVNRTPARTMFEQLGYESIRVMPNFLPNNENAYEMRKELVEEYVYKTNIENPADWSELNRDLLGLVVRGLRCDDDYVRIGDVCRSWRLVGDVCQSWRSIAIDNRCPLSQYPALMVPRISELSETRRLLRLNREGSYFEQGYNYDQLQVPHGHICRGSAYGWLFLTDDNLDVRLLNPFSGAEIQLPSVTSLPVPSGSNDMPAWGQMSKFYVYKAIYSSNPSFQPLPVVFIIYGGLSLQLAFCKPGDEEWTTLQSPLDQDDYYKDAIYYKDQFYALSVRECIVAAFDIGCGIDVGDDHHPVLKAIHIAAKPSMGDLYLVEVDGELVKLERELKIEVYDDSDGDVATVAARSFQTMGFKIQKFEASEEKWVNVKDLGDNALFLGYNTSFSFSASKFPGCVRNSVYFTNGSGGNEDAGHDMGIYYLIDETVKPLYSMDDSDQLTNPSPFWVTHFDCSCSHAE